MSGPALHPKITYFYGVTAIDTEDAESEPSDEASAVPSAADILLVNDEGGGFGDALAQAVLASDAFLDRWSTDLGSPP